MTMAKLILAWILAFVAFTSASAAPPPTETAVAYRSGDLSLAALLIRPSASTPRPAVVIVHGSGKSDRSNAWAREFADTLVAAGFAVLLTDKRGSGLSQGNWQTSGFEELAADALAGVEYLKRQAGIDPRRIGLLGLSQGGRVAPIAAARSTEVAFVINVVGDALSFGEQSAHEMANVARQAGLSEEHRRQVLELNRAAGEALLTGEWSQYEVLRKAGLASPWAKIAAGFPPVGAPVWEFLRKSQTFDPMSYWILTRQPVLIVYGEADERDNVAVAESVRRLRFGFDQVGKTNVQISVLPGLGHSLRSADGKLADSARSTITAWLAQYVTPPGD